MSSLPKNYKVINRVPVSKDVLPKIRISRLMPDGHGKCIRCGIEATHVITYTLESQAHKTVHSNIFARNRMLTADHILPYSLGGNNQLSNLQLMCYNCNSNKGNMPSFDEMQRIIQNRSKHFRTGFKPKHMRHAIKLFPSLTALYDLSGQEDGPAVPFKPSSTGQNPPGFKMKQVKIKSHGLVDNHHPHHPMWGWVRIFERFPEMKSAVRFA